MARAFGLGRGLESLIPHADEATGVRELALDRIVPNPRQPRARFDDAELADMADSIRAHGVLQPIIVRARVDGQYELIAGERRLRASRLAGRETVPALVRDATDGDQLELALIENVQRADLNAIEEALAYRELTDRFGLSHEEVARRVGKSRGAVSNALRLLELTPETRAAIADGQISEGHGRALASITVPELQRAVLRLVVERHLSVRQTEELVRRKREEAPRRSQARAANDLGEVEAALRGVLATKVGIVRTRKGGRVVIDFYSDEELDRIYSIISRGADSTASVPGGSSARADDGD